MLSKLKTWARALKREITVLRVAMVDPRTPWYARWSGILVVAYALSPVDLIPDFIPILGYLDDLLLLPLGLYLTLKMIPESALAEARRQVQEGAEVQSRPNWVVGSLIVATWLVGLGLLVYSVVPL
ncbi:MAG: DUF1232 domain-containing protein [Candidatus Eremiobacteraeota bacterium]|nr:DUF1232 domain-containing protein [Candidatus Eremiobacteraeota bacterium]